MKKAIILFLSAFLVCVASFYIHLAMGASVFGPKAEVREVCTSQIAGMSLPEIDNVVAQYKNMDIFTDGQKELQISKVAGGWICVCKATLKADGANKVQVATVDDVFCSD